MPHGTPGRTYTYTSGTRSGSGFAEFDGFKVFDRFMASGGLGEDYVGGGLYASMGSMHPRMPGSPMARDHMGDGSSPHVRSRYRGEEREMRRERERESYREKERERDSRDRDRERDRYASETVNGRSIERDSHRDSHRDNSHRDSKHGKSNGRSKGSDPSVVERKLMISLEEIFKGVQKKLLITRKAYDTDGKIVPEEKILDITVRPGMRPGSKFKFTGVGDENSEGGTQDLHIILEEKPHERFTRDGDDLITTIDITLKEALTVKVNIKFPTSLTAEQKEKLKEIL
ncbi:hypothetical protein ABW19_dt0200076 [Dactylella cylindrospora]|nr:hypothetical protein ABW19_dt0200076 [Dactylella cylindrospora]